MEQRPSAFLLWLMAGCAVFWFMVCTFVPPFRDWALAFWNLFRDIANF